MWKDIADQLPGRIGENIRQRYVNHLNPTLKKSKWTKEEDDILFETQRRVGNRWSEIRKFLPGRSDNSIKNRYHNRKNSQLRKMNQSKKEGKRKNPAKASAKPAKKARTSHPETPLILEDFPDAVIGI